MAIKPFAQLYAQALTHFPSEEALEEQLPEPLPDSFMRHLSDDRFLSAMCLRVFRAGLKHSMVDDRWPSFERAFYEFNPDKLALMSDEQLEQAMEADGVIKHWGKVKAIRLNALFVQEVAAAHGKFGEWLADWPVDNIIGLWAELNKRGGHLGGRSGPAFLRLIGKDTFMPSQDVEQVLVEMGVVDKWPGSQKGLQAVQDVFNQWREECGRPLCEISRIVSYTAS